MVKIGNFGRNIGLKFNESFNCNARFERTGGVAHYYKAVKPHLPNYVNFLFIANAIKVGIYQVIFV